MIARRPAARPGFTLLEVLLASAIGVLLLGGLYVAFDLTLRQTDAGREAVERGDLSRAIVNRMAMDLSASLGPLQPKSGGGITQQAGTTTSSGTTSSSSSTSGGSSSEDTTGSTETTEEEAAADVPFQGGVFGTETQLTLYISRVPPALTTVESADGSGLADARPDLRRVTYYLGAGGGLCRQEKPWVTADGVRNSVDPDTADEPFDLLSDEVTDVAFEYFDGSGWAGQWSGSDTAADGKTPLGPPRAIRVTLTIQPGGGPAKVVRHVFPVRAAVGLYQPPTAETTDAASTTGGM
jgi:prepilin-type N-terminal cleavage/methylation domain-containing protein